METPSVRYGQIDPHYFERLATTPPEEDGPVWMVNLMKYGEVADYIDGRATTLTGREADDAYAPLEQLAAVGAEVVFFAEVEDQLLGDEPKWDRVAVVKYPTRRSFVDMQSRPDYVELHEHKEAGMEQSIILGCQPMVTPVIPDPPDWADVPHPPMAEDGPVMVIHVIKFVEGGIPDMDSYQDAASLVAVPHGVRLAGWFGVEGTIIGDGRDVGPGPIQRVPEQGRVHGGRLRPGADEGAPRPPRAGDGRHLHDDPPAGDRPVARLDHLSWMIENAAPTGSVSTE